jgi:hypothetical protein
MPVQEILGITTHLASSYSMSVDTGAEPSKKMKQSEIDELLKKLGL